MTTTTQTTRGAARWERMTAGPGQPFDGYRTSDGHIEITDNGNGFGSSRNSGRWALTIDGQWVANVDTLAEAKQRAQAQEEQQS